MVRNLGNYSQKTTEFMPKMWQVKSSKLRHSIQDADDNFAGHLVEANIANQTKTPQAQNVQL